MKKHTICIVGLGYVGLPLAHAFAKVGYAVIGYDVRELRIQELKNEEDSTNELSKTQLSEVNIEFSTNPDVIAKADIVILAIPTPVTEDHKPDLSLLMKATETVAEYMKNDITNEVIVVFESTVYPGITEDLCGDILHKSGKIFKLGYSPERVNPGDKEHTIDKIVKVVAGEDEETTDILCDLYGSIITAGIHRAPSIKVAEMAKAIENAQRDLNIAYVNEIAKLCSKLDISTKDVLDAAGTKWNFLKFTPGLVGGHCIGVDPYYLLEKAKQLNIEMPIITAARETNDGMASHIAKTILKKLNESKKNIIHTELCHTERNRGMEQENKIKYTGFDEACAEQRRSAQPDTFSILILGMTFKEDVPDERNTKVPDIAEELRNSGCDVGIVDPFIHGHKNLSNLDERIKYDAILLLVPHKEYRALEPLEFKKLAKNNCLFYDLKSVLSKEKMEAVGFTYLSL